MNQNRLKKFAVYLALLLVILGGGYYLGGTYGFSPFETQRQQQKKVSEVEGALNENLDRGLVSAVVGRILEIGRNNSAIRLADQTLGVIYKTPSGYVERTVEVNESTLVVREEVAGGPHFLTKAGRLREGQFVSVYLSQNDFKADNAIAKEIVIQEHVPLP